MLMLMPMLSGNANSYTNGSANIDEPLCQVAQRQLCHHFRACWDWVLRPLPHWLERLHRRFGEGRALLRKWVLMRVSIQLHADEVMGIWQIC